MASNRAATWAAFATIAKRGLTTHTPTQICPAQIPLPQSILLQPPQHRQTLVSTSPCHGRKLPRNHFTSNRAVQHERSEEPARPAKRKAARAQASPTSLRRVAVEAQRSRTVIQGKGVRAHVNPDVATRAVTAYCAAETYNIHIARDVLRREGYEPDPLHTGLFPQVLHVQTRNEAEGQGASGGEAEPLTGGGDVFVFPSGSVVAWNVPDKVAHRIVERILPRAAVNSHVEKLEAEDLEYVEDPTREHSLIVGETVILGTRATHAEAAEAADAGPGAEYHQKHEADAILTKIAFSSALARSTKLAVLENMLDTYFSTTRTIPSTLSSGRTLPFNRRFILQKTGELLTIRAQLNLYSELTDSLPDLFWDSPHELGLESYYEQVGRALDVGVRIKVLNERMDYASEIAAVLRERLSEKHSSELEWLIIGLIALEVLIEFRNLWLEWREWLDPASTEALTREWLRRELSGGTSNRLPSTDGR